MEAKAKRKCEQLLNQVKLLGEMEFLCNKYLKVNDSNIIKSQNVSLIISIFNQHMNDEHEDKKLPCSECDRYWTCQIL